MKSSNNILLIRPANFGFNTETAASNAFQNNFKKDSTEVLQQHAQQEFEVFAETLKSKGVNVFIFDDTPSVHKPDAVFPNNWISFHQDGTIILYPMFASNRRLERRQDIIDSLRKDFKITNIFDLSEYENESKFLEGTGSIVFDHESKVAYACLSQRTNKELFIKVAEYLHYKPVYFNGVDKSEKQIYHTNVMMCIADKFSVICLESISDEQEKRLVCNSLINTHHEIIEITFDQMNNFAGNMLSIHTNDDKAILVLSQLAFQSLTKSQKMKIEKYCEFVSLSIDTIETIGGGSARCMIAEIFLPMIN